jgi:hypothetical protein
VQCTAHEPEPFTPLPCVRRYRLSSCRRLPGAGFVAACSRGDDFWVRSRSDLPGPRCPIVTVLTCANPHGCVPRLPVTWLSRNRQAGVTGSSPVPPTMRETPASAGVSLVGEGSGRLGPWPTSGPNVRATSPRRRRGSPRRASGAHRRAPCQRGGYTRGPRRRYPTPPNSTRTSSTMRRIQTQVATTYLLSGYGSPALSPPVRASHFCGPSQFGQGGRCLTERVSSS